MTSHITANASGMKQECRKSHLVNIISKKIIIDITLIMLLFTWPFIMLRLKALKSTPFPLNYCAMGFVAYMDRIRFVRLPPKRYQHTNMYYHIFILKCHITPISTVLQAAKHDSVIYNVIQQSETTSENASVLNLTNLIQCFSKQIINEKLFETKLNGKIEQYVANRRIQKLFNCNANNYIKNNKIKNKDCNVDLPVHFDLFHH